MSEYEGEYGYESYGVDEGYDANEIAQAAAEQAAASLAPLIQQQQQQINMLSATTMAAAQRGMLETERETNAMAVEAQRIAAQRSPGFEQRAEQLGAYLERQPELLPEHALGDAESTAEALLRADRMYRQDLAERAARQREDLAQAHIDQINQGLRGSKW
jgi:hypothetical protein